MILSKDNAEDGLRLLARGYLNGRGRLVSRHCTANKRKPSKQQEKTPGGGFPQGSEMCKVLLVPQVLTCFR